MLKMPVIWLIIIVVMTAYCAYWSSYSINPYATDVILTTAAVAGAISVARMWLKPASGFIAGFVADRFGVAISTSCSVCNARCQFPGDGWSVWETCPGLT